MANQRMFIRCRSCGEQKFLAKHSLAAFRTHHAWGMSMSEWNEWFDKHEWGFCGDGASGLDIFELVYEDPPDAEIFEDPGCPPDNIEFFRPPSLPTKEG